MNSCGSGPSSTALRSFAECSVYGSQPSKRFANRRASLLGLGRGDIEMCAGTQGVRAINEHENAMLLQRRRYLFRGAEFCIYSEEHNVGFHLRRMKVQAWRLRDGLGYDPGMAMVFGETVNVMVQSIEGAGRRHAGLAHAAAKQLSDFAGPR